MSETEAALSAGLPVFMTCVFLGVVCRLWYFVETLCVVPPPRKVPPVNDNARVYVVVDHPAEGEYAVGLLRPRV